MTMMKNHHLTLPLRKSDYSEAVIYNDTIFCVDCLPKGTDINSEGVTTIFASDRWEGAYPICDICGAIHTYIIFIPREVKDEDKPVLTITYHTTSKNTAIDTNGAWFTEFSFLAFCDPVLCNLCGILLEGSDHWLCVDGGEVFCENCILDVEDTR